MKMITIEQVCNGWLLIFEVLGTAEQVKKVCTTNNEVEQQVALWLDQSPNKSLSE